MGVPPAPLWERVSCPRRRTGTGFGRGGRPPRSSRSWRGATTVAPIARFRTSADRCGAATGTPFSPKCGCWSAGGRGRSTWSDRTSPRTGRTGERNGGYAPAGVWALPERVRKRVPGVFLRTSLIVGFPGETAAAFDRLLRFVHESRWDYLGVFPYSREEGTPAHAMERQIPAAVKRGGGGGGAGVGRARESD